MRIFGVRLLFWEGKKGDPGKRMSMSIVCTGDLWRSGYTGEDEEKKVP